MLKEIIRFLIYLLFIFSINISNNADFIKDSNNKSDVYFSLNIPQINLYKNVYKYNSNDNDVNKGIYMVNKYSFDKLNGSLILASHSGSSRISYFKNLNNLKLNDVFYITYKGNNYYYQVDNIYRINKNGKFRYKDMDKTIYMITCDKNNKKKQIVFYGKLIKIVKKSSFF